MNCGSISPTKELSVKTKERIKLTPNLAKEIGCILQRL